MIKKGAFLKALISAFSVSVLAQVFGLIRQILMAAYFGISRNLDIYFMTYAIAMITVFSFGVIFDTVSIPHLVRNLEEKRESVFRQLTGSIFLFSVLFSLILSLVFIIAVPIATRLMTVGFSIPDKKAVESMSLYFLPWILVSLPYYALCSFYKSIRHFNIVFFGEVVISVVSLVFIFLFHSDTKFIPLAYFMGYLFAFSMLFTLSFKYFNRVGRLFSAEMKKVYKNFAELFGANQIGALSSVVERFFQSFLLSGGISVLSYSAQITTNMAGMLSFRDIFLVPLSAVKDRSEKLERTIIGLSMIAMPIMLFLSYYSGDVVSFLFQRGKFGADAVLLTSSVLSVYSLVLLPGIAGVPVFRMFQVIDKIKLTGVVYLITAVNFAVLGTLFVFVLKLGVHGMALMVVISGYISSAVSLYMLNKNGIRVNVIKIFKYIVYSMAASLLTLFLVKIIPYYSEEPFMRLLVHGSIYMGVILIAYLPLRKKMSYIVGGAL